MNLVYSLTSVQSYTHTPFHPHLSPSPSSSPSLASSSLPFPSPPPHPTLPHHSPTLPLSHSPTSSPTLPKNPIHPLKYPQSPQSPANQQIERIPPPPTEKQPKKNQNLPPLKSTNPTPRNFPPWIKHQNPSLGNSNSQIPPTIRLENLARENFHQRHFRCKSACCGR